MSKLSTKDEAKADRERKIFRLFAKSLGWQFTADSVESRSQPEPDILYHSEDGTTAFELAEICASDVAAQGAGLKESSKTTGVGGVSAIWTSDPTGQILQAKLGKTYVSGHPIDLLCYTNGRVVSPDSIVESQIAATLSSALHVGFRRVWYFGENVILEFSPRGENIRSFEI